MKDRYLLQVLSTCQDLHMDSTGAGPPVQLREEKLEWLERRMLSWEEPTSPYDSAVLALVQETLREWDWCVLP